MVDKCNEPDFVKDLNVDPIPPYCGRENEPNLNDPTNAADLSWLEEKTQEKVGFGKSAQCDPMQKGHIINEQGMEKPQREVIYRYTRAIRGCDEAMKDLFSDIVVEDDNGKIHQIPIIWGTQEKAVAAVLQTNVRKDESLVVDRIRLPILSIYNSGIEFNRALYTYHKAINWMRDEKGHPGFTTKERYEKDTVLGVARGIPVNISYRLFAWTMYEEDMNQIYEQIQLKFSPIAYIRVRGVPWETIVEMGTPQNNLNLEPGDQATRVYKWEFGFTVQSFIPQPIVRKKAVLKTKITLTDNVDDEKTTTVLGRLEEGVNEFEKYGS